MRIPLILASLLLASCSYLEAPVLSPYKMDIRQGNYITPEMREKLKPGMSKSQARYVMGTAMVSDVFHNNRWDYVYTLERRGEVIERQHMTLYFDGDTLVRVEEGGKTIAELTVVVPPVAEAEQAKPDISAGILQRVERWAAAWSSKNAGDYLASYIPDYAPQGMSRAAWEKQRLARIGKPNVIEVGLSEMRVSVQDELNATATFVQSYRSDVYRDVVEKTLRLVKQGDTWLIADEHAGKAAAAK
ncbi:MAG: outer membrane protein assembly factor BamE [Gallionella sp.]|nr:outer membrane protein assembly factor BamE [Gallionella sp.]